MKDFYEVWDDEEGRRQVKPWNREVWICVGRDVDMELFSTRPKTPGVGGDPENWPPGYKIYVGNMDGGDTLCVEERNDKGEVWLRNLNEDQFWTLVMKEER